MNSPLRDVTNCVPNRRPVLVPTPSTVPPTTPQVVPSPQILQQPPSLTRQSSFSSTMEIDFYFGDGSDQLITQQPQQQQQQQQQHQMLQLQFCRQPKRTANEMSGEGHGQRQRKRGRTH